MEREIKFNKETMIVSETDAKGIITYANEDFCKVAGFTKDELIDQHHSIVRHSDMPKAAFKDLWETIQKGETWKGIVKNRTKNGDFYWVNATAYPVEKKSGEKKYISVRVKPTKKEVEIAQNLYKVMLKEEQNVF